MSEICARELRATLLGNQPDWKPTHETAAWVHWYNTRRPTSRWAASHRNKQKTNTQ